MTDARTLVERALAAEPDQHDVARSLYEQALAAAPGDPLACAGLARLALREGDIKGAVAHCRVGLAVTPSHSGLLTTLGQVLRAAGALDAAVEALGAAAEAMPNDPAGWMAAGSACMEAELARQHVARKTADSGQPGSQPELLELAMESFRRAAALQPAAAAPPAHLAMAARYACAWSRADPALRSLAALHTQDPEHFAVSPMMAAALLDDPIAQRDGIRGFARSTLPAPVASARVVRRGHRLRVGYLSSDLHDHATAHLVAGMFEQHDRGRVEVFAYALDRDDGSAMRRRLQKAFEHWRDVGALADDEVARRIAGDELDVLVDLKGHTHGARLAILARRPAPVQLHYLGFPGTIAYGAVDGIIADAIVAPPGSEGEFAEAVLRLPVCYQVNDAARPLPGVARRSDVGLPERALVLTSFNQTYKLTEPFVAVWLEVLRDVPDAVLWLYVPHALARRNLLALAMQAGVAGERIVFAPAVPQSEHIARLRCADLALDVLPYGSHTTGSDALWAGVPLLTCRGTTFAGRVGASLCQAVEMPELVTESMTDYAGVLRDLCADRSRLAHYRRHLESGRTHLPLFDTATFTRAFEGLLEDAANRTHWS